MFAHGDSQEKGRSPEDLCGLQEAEQRLAGGLLYPMPRIDDILDQLGKPQFISTMDLTRGYWQVPVEQKARHKTAFSTPFGLYQFKMMPFGLQGAPATFQRLMDHVIREMNGFASAYLDDLIIYSSSWADHVSHLRRVLERLVGAGLTAKLSKS